MNKIQNNTTAHEYIPTSSTVLENVLSGGFKKGKLFIFIGHANRGKSLISDKE